MLFCMAILTSEIFFSGLVKNVNVIFYSFFLFLAFIQYLTIPVLMAMVRTNTDG